MRPVLCEHNGATVSVYSSNANNPPAQAKVAKNWNIAAILCGDDEFHISRGSFFGSTSLDGTVSGFWPILWDFLIMSWVPKMLYSFVDWPYRAVTRRARILQREGKGPARPFVNTEAYPNRNALILIKNTLKRWLENNPGFCVLIGGPGARVPNTQTNRYYIRCFGEIRFRSSGRNCVVDAACSAAYLLLGEEKATFMNNHFMGVALRASQRLRPFNEGKAEIIDFTSIGHLGPVFQGLGGNFSVKKVKNLALHGRREPPHERFNWLFSKRIHGHLYIDRLYEAGVVDHLVLIDYRQWPSLIYDSYDPTL